MKLALFCLCFSICNSQPTLKFIQVWFRHGERLPTHYLQFPNDPVNSAYLTMTEPGELTTRGIQQEYRLGQLLKERYGDFLGEYKPKEIHTYTGVDNRTVASAQAVFAGLYPPQTLWNPNLAWQPVSMHTEEAIDWVSTGIEGVCPTYQEKLFNSPEFKSIPSQLDQALLKYLRNVTGGLPRDDVVDINRVVDSLVCRAALNDSRLPFPEWAEPVKDLLEPFHLKLHVLVLALQNQTVGGNHLEKMLAYMEDHLLRPANKINKAVFLAAHDTNIMLLAKLLNMDTIPKPTFGSYIVIELHEIDGVHQIKIFNRNGVDAELVEVFPKYCGNPCTLERLQSLAKDHRVSDAVLLKTCKSVGPIKEENFFLYGILIALTAIFLLTTVIFGCTSYNYKKQLKELNDPERTHLLR